MARKEVGEINDKSFTLKGLKNLAKEINIPIEETFQELNIQNGKIALFLLAEDILNEDHSLPTEKLVSHDYSPTDKSFFYNCAPAISSAIHERETASSPKELKTALEKLDQILIEKSEKAETVYQLSTLYYTAPTGSKARKPILEKIYKLLN